MILQFQASAPLKQKYAPEKSKCEAEKNDKFHGIDWQVYHKKNNFCLLFVKSRAPRQDDGTVEDLSPWTSFCPPWDK